MHVRSVSHRVDLGVLLSPFVRGTGVPQSLAPPCAQLGWASDVVGSVGSVLETPEDRERNPSWSTHHSAD